MASLDTLPADQRAVLQLVLKQGRSYDEIAKLLSIDRAAVRERALAAFDALGPGTGVPPERRALITDYLLGQLPPRVADETRSRLGQSAGDRAWARVIASELAPAASQPLPEIPVEDQAGEPAQPEQSAAEASEATTQPATAATAQPTADEARAETSAQAPQPPGRSSRAGGAILLGAGALVVVIVVLVIILVSGGSSKHHSTTSANASRTATTQTSASTSATPVAQITLKSPSGKNSPAGVAVVVKQGGNQGIVIRAQGMAANTSHDAYAVWLYNSQSDNRMLGFVNPGVKKDGALQTLGALPANASHFTQLLVTLENQGKPRAPGTIVLQGPLKLS